jgi:hypothetical protein
MQSLEYHAVYINLDRRTDRRESIESVLDSLQIPIDRRTRFPAIYHSLGWVGCTQSHCAVIEMAKREGWPAVLVFEDDFSLTVPPEEFHRVVLEAQDIPHDVLLCAYHVEASEEVPGISIVRRAFSAQAPSAYIVHSHFYDRLLENYRAAVAGALRGGEHWNYINDQYWKRLQADRSTTWLYCTPRLGIQKAGYSDLAHAHVDYKV